LYSFPNGFGDYGLLWKHVFNYIGWPAFSRNSSSVRDCSDICLITVLNHLGKDIVRQHLAPRMDNNLIVPGISECFRRGSSSLSVKLKFTSPINCLGQPTRIQYMKIIKKHPTIGESHGHGCFVAIITELNDSNVVQLNFCVSILVSIVLNPRHAPEFKI
jgi:hypothetical protein